MKVRIYQFDSKPPTRTVGADNPSEGIVETEISVDVELDEKERKYLKDIVREVLKEKS